MKKVYLLLTTLLLCVCSLMAQAPERFSYQAVVRDASNHLITGASVSVRVSVLQGSVTGNTIYSETQTAVTNANGLMTLEIGGGTNQTGTFSSINWGYGPYFLKTEIDPTGGNNYSISSVQQLLSVPYALYSKEAGNGFSGDYNDLTNTPTIPAAQVNSDWNATTGVAEILNKPTIPAVPTNVSAFTNDAGYVTSAAIPTVPTNVSAFTNDAGYVTSSAIPTVPTNVSAFTNDVPYLTTEQQALSISNDTIYLSGGSFVKLPATATGFSGNYSDLVGAPNLATVATSGSYNDLTNTPTIPAAQVNSDWNATTGVAQILNKPTIPAAQVNADWNATSGVAEILNKPEIPTVPTNVGDFNNNVGYITMDQLTVLMNNMMNSVNARLDSMQQVIDSLQNLQPAGPSAAPSVSTTAVSGVTDVSATCGGNVTSNGGGAILERGLCWSTSANPTIAGNHIAIAGDTGVFTGTLTDLTPGTTYHVRAFATNALGTTYGEEFTFNTAAQVPYLGFRLGNSWVLNNGNCQNYWMTGVVDNADSTVGLFVTTDGSNFGYNANAASTIMAELLMQMPGLDSIHVEFDLRCGGESQWDFLKAFLCLPSVTFEPGNNDNDYSGFSYSGNNAFNFAEFTTHTGNPSNAYKINLTQGNTLHISMNVVNPAPNGQAKLVFLWRNDSSLGTQPGAVITNLIVCDPANAPAVLSVSTSPVTQIQAVSAVCGGEVFYDDDAAVTARGVCWSTNPTPTIADSHTVDGSGTGVFTSQITGLTSLTTYYVRAYATGNGTTVYGEEVSFQTTQLILVPTVQTQSVTNIHETYAQGSGYVTSSGGVTILERGLCWSTSPNPTLNDYHAAHSLNGLGPFGLIMDDLFPGTTYYVRAYAINSAGVGYGEDVIFTTVGLPVLATVQTLPPSEITQTSAVWNGEVVSDNGYPVLARGFIWGYDSNLLQNNAGSIEVGSGTGYFFTIRDNLAPSTTYYVVAYAQNSVGTAYGEVVSFTTGALLPSVITTQVVNVEATSAICGGIVSDDGGGDITSRGLCWSTTANPTVSDSIVTVTGGLGSFTAQIDGLEPYTTYYVRAYATNSAGTAYGNELTFTTKAIKPASDGQPCPGHATVTDVDGNVYNTVKIGDQCWMKENLRATHYADGKEIPNRYAPNWDTLNVPEYGYLYRWNAMMNGANGSSANPSGVQGACPQGWHVPSNAEWEQLNNYVLSQPAYFCTAYSANTIAKALASQTGWAYHEVNCEVGHNPEENNATGFSAMPAGYYAGTQMNGFGQFAYFGSSTCEDNYSQVWRIGYNKNDFMSLSLYSGVTSVRCVLGEGAKLAEVVTRTVEDVTDVTVAIRGEVTGDGGANVTARGFCWNASLNPTLANSNVSEVGGTGEYILQISGLEPGSYYYARAYVTNELGTSYGDVVSFRTDYSMPEGDAQPCPNMPTVTDVDGNVYNTVKLGNQCWMAENLRTTHYADGQEIPYGLTLTTPVMACRYAPDGDLSLVSQYGYLYNWVAAMKGANTATANPSGVQGVCPDGWHMPSPAEWTQLTTYLGSYPVYQSNNSSSSYIAKALAANEDWQLSGTAFVVGNDLSKNNRAGFNVYPAGSVSFPSYHEINQEAFFWSTSLSGNIRISYNSQSIHAQSLSASTGISVRCVYGAGNNVAYVSTQSVGQITTNSAVCGGNVTADGGADVTARGICWSTSSNPTTANSHTTDGAGLGSFTSTMTGLELNTDYYVRAYATNSVGTVYGNVVMFHTLTDDGEATEYSMPEVITSPVTNLRAESATCGGNVLSDGGTPVTSRGICWSTSPNPTLADNQTTNGTGLGSFTSQITGLTVGTTYFVRAYAVNSIGTSYGNELTFSLQMPAGDGQPCPNAATVTDYDQNVYNTVLIGNQCWMKENLRSTHTADGKVITNLVAPQEVPGNVIAYGYLYNWNAVMQGSSSSSANPSGVQGICPTGWHLPSDAEWSQLTNYLESQSVYQCGTVSSAIAKALAAETGWTTYTTTCAVGNDLSGNNLTGFSALPAGDEIAGNFGQYALFWSSTMSEMQGYPYTLGIFNHSYGVNRSVNPQTSSLSVRCLQGVGSNAAAVTTAAVMDITDVSATLGGNVVSDGGSAVTERGVCWSTAHNPTTASEHVATGTGVGNFTTQVSGLNPTTTYYVRAYAVNAMATVYGAEITFTTAAALPVIPEGDGQPCPGAATVTDFDNNVYSTVKIGEQCWMKENLKAAHYADGTEITHRYLPNGSAGNVGAYGYLYTWSEMMNGANSASGKPSGVQGACPAGWHVPSNAEWQQLTDYVKSQGAYRCFGSSSNYAKSLAADAGWNTSSLTCAVGNDLTQNNATGFSAMPAGYASSNGNSTSQFGQVAVFWTATLGTAAETNRLFSFNSNDCNSLTYSMDNAYSVRCVRGAGNSLATVVTNTVSNITTTSATCGGSVIDDGGANVTERGICWSTVQSPTVNDSRLTSGNGMGSFSATLTGLSSGTTYYVRAYAINSLGTVYGNEVTFTAETPTIDPVVNVPTVTTLTVSNITSESATLSGNVTDDGNATVTERGVCWSTSHNPTVAGNHTVSGTGMGSFMTSVAGLNAGTTYYVRAYAVNSEGTAYGNEVSFTTLAPTGDGQPCPDMATMTDYDGNVYNTVKIGEQCWMKENLRTSHYANGAEVSDRRMPAGDPANVAAYGYLYNWSEVMNGATATNANPSGVQGICPAGWHLPSAAEWSQLTDYLSGVSAYGCGNMVNATAKSLASEIGWAISYVGCAVGSDPSQNNLTGFSAMPAGTSSYSDFGHVAYFWSATSQGGSNAKNFALYSNQETPYQQDEYTGTGMSVRCVRGLGASVASVTTVAVSNLTDVTVTCGGNVTADGGATVTERGVCWGTSHNPTTAGSHTASGDGVGEFSLSISELTPSTVYYVRAYAVNATGTSYGAEVSFQTLSNSPYASANDGQPCVGNPTVTDFDGNVYNTVQIGNQCWMKENLRVTHYANATAIPDGTNGAFPSRYNPYGDASQVTTYGLLYNWYAVMNGASSSNVSPSNVQGVCPTGWHVPSDVEWQQMIDYVRSQNAYLCGGSISKYAKALAANTLWNTSTTNCAVGNDLAQNNLTGFSALPAGYRNSGGGFSNIGTNAAFWTTSRNGSAAPLNRNIAHNYADVSRLTVDGGGALSVRCVLGAGASLPEVSTAAVSETTTTTAVCGGEVENEGGSAVTVRGICWSTSNNPTIADSRTSDGSGIGTFTSSLTGLSAGITYYVRAYATSALGTNYGDVVTFTTGAPVDDGMPCTGVSTVQDYDGNYYNTVKIGNQCWLKENMKSLHFADGVAIPDGSLVAASSSDPFYYYPGNDATKAAQYGLLYNWSAALNNLEISNENPSGVQGICPNGWHVPSNAEWQQLIDYVNGMNAYQCSGQNGYIAKALSATTGWSVNYTNCTPGNNLPQNNSIGFSAMPAGSMSQMNTSLGYSADFWSTSLAYVHIYSETPEVALNPTNSRDEGYSVRCIKNAQRSKPTIRTVEVNSMMSTTATVVSDLTYSGGDQITGRGVVWSTSSHPTLANNRVDQPGAMGELSSSLTNLEPNTTYYVRAYAMNNFYVAYGQELKFHTFPAGDLEPCPDAATVTDYDGNVYNTVKLGSQCWMRENLHSTHYADGSVISDYHYFMPNADYVNVYGYHYNWSTTMRGASETDANPSGVQGICPDGWHVPSSSEWQQLIEHLCSSPNYLSKGWSNAIAKGLASATQWSSSTVNNAVGANYSLNNITGFTAMPAGVYNGSAVVDIYQTARFWSTSIHSTAGTTTYLLSYDSPILNLSPFNPEFGASVRCVRGAGASVPTVNTTTVVRTGNSAARASGTITSNGGSAITERGICWSKDPNPMVSDPADKHAVDVYSIDSTSIAAELSNLTESGYYVRAYATNGAGTGYGEEIYLPLNEIVVPKSGAESYTVAPSVSSFHVYDHAGSGANYDPMCDGTLELKVNNSLKAFKLDVTCNTEIAYDKLLIYEGSVSPNNLLAEVSGQNVTNGPIYSSGNQIVMRFMSDNSTHYSGFDVNVRVVAAIPQDDAQPCPGIPTVTDVDNHVYNTVKIGNQCWMKENLRTTHYADGTSIAAGNSASATVPYRYTPNVPSQFSEASGLLYNWAAVMHGAGSSTTNPSGVQGICPDGWHVPSVAEWNQLTDYVSAHPVYLCNNNPGLIARSLVAGALWVYSGPCTPSESFSQNNLTGFSILPVGIYDGSVSGVGTSALFWSTNDNPSGNAFASYMYNSSLTFTTMDQNKAHGYSVRCVYGAGDNELPVVSTGEVVRTHANVARCTGHIDSEGGSEVTEKGFCWSTSPNPTLTDPTTLHVSVESMTSDLNGVINNLTGNSYYVRAYATNNAGTAYGQAFHLMKTDLIVPKTGTETYNVPTNKTSFHVYDHGGQYDGYDKNCSGSLVVTASNTSKALKMTVKTWLIAPQDKLYIYEGTSTDNLIAEMTGDDNHVPVRSAGNTVTLRFVSNDFSQSAGFDVAVELVTPAPAGDALPCPGTPTVTDIDGNVYNTVKIGNQCWMRESLKAKHFPNGNSIAAGSTDSLSYVIPQYYYPNNSQANMNAYGLLYNWVAAVNNPGHIEGVPPMQGICPTGWHMPIDSEWNLMRTYLNNIPAYQCEGQSGAIARSLASTEGWLTVSYYDDICTPSYYLAAENNNATGFSALPAGGRNSGDLFWFNQMASFWSRTTGSTVFKARAFEINYNESGATLHDNDKCDAYSVRCIKDN